MSGSTRWDDTCWHCGVDHTEEVCPALCADCGMWCYRVQADATGTTYRDCWPDERILKRRADRASAQADYERWKREQERTTNQRGE